MTEYILRKKKPAIKKKGLDVRGYALKILNEVDEKKETLDAVINEFHRQNPDISKLDSSFLNALVYGVLRWRGRIDRIISCFSRTEMERISLPVLNLLRIGIFQICYLDRVPVSAAVNTCVEIAKTFAPEWVVPYINAVLRNAARSLKRTAFPTGKSAEAVSVNKSFPIWLIKRWTERLGIEETLGLCDSINKIPLITIRSNSLRIKREALAEMIKNEVENIRFTESCPDGICFSNPKIPILKLAGFNEGLFQVQDEAAQLVSIALDPQPGERVLDACAGLGGKSGHIAALMKNEGEILCLDNNEKKLAALREDMKRLEITITETFEHNLDFPLNIKEKFDRVLLDAPCSGIGVLRKNPDIKWNCCEKNILRCAKKQRLFLDNIAGVVKDSGLMVYSVCSTEREENEEVIEGFLERHSEFFLKKSFRTSPNDNMDGFFCAVLKRAEGRGDEKNTASVYDIDWFYSTCLCFELK